MKKTYFFLFILCLVVPHLFAEENYSSISAWTVPTKPDSILCMGFANNIRVATQDEIDGNVPILLPLDQKLSITLKPIYENVPSVINFSEKDVTVVDPSVLTVTENNAWNFYSGNTVSFTVSMICSPLTVGLTTLNVVHEGVLIKELTIRVTEPSDVD